MAASSMEPTAASNDGTGLLPEDVNQRMVCMVSGSKSCRANESTSVASVSIAGKRWSYCADQSELGRAPWPSSLACSPMMSLMHPSSSSQAAAFSR